LSRQGAWYVIRTAQKAEKKAADELGKLGIPVELPMRKELVKLKHKRKPVYQQQPLLPTYLFAKVEEEQWRAVRKCKSVLWWISNMEGPLPIPEGQVESFMERVRFGEFDSHGVASGLKPGDQLAIIAGPFKDWMVSFVSATGETLNCKIDGAGFASFKVNIRDVRPSKRL